MAKKPTRKSPSRSISENEVAQFAKKLDRWGDSLPENERALLDLIVNRARLLEPDAVLKARVQKDLLVATRQVFVDLKDVLAPEAWVRIDPIWYKSGGIDFREFEITTKATLKRR